MTTPQSSFSFPFAGDDASGTNLGFIKGAIFAVSKLIKMCQSCFQDDDQLEDEHLFLMVDTISRDDVLGQRCGVCSLGFWDANEVVVWRNCHHKFHVGCIIEWYKANTTCPMCFCRKSLFTSVFCIHDEPYAAQGIS